MSELPGELASTIAIDGSQTPAPAGANGGAEHQPQSSPVATDRAKDQGAARQADADAVGKERQRTRGDATDPAGDREIRDPPRVGGRDANGSEITATFSCTRQFVIYQAAEQVRFMLPENYAVARALRQRVADLGGLRASIEDLRSHPALAKTNECTRAARELSWALQQAFEDDSTPPSERPKEILTRVDARLRSLVKSHYRKKYVLANLGAFVAIEIILLAMAIVFEFLFPMGNGNLAALPRYAMYGAFGGLGAFLSVITSIRSIDVDMNLKTWEHIFAGATRIMIGVIGALIVALALDSSFIDPTFGNSTSASTKGTGGLERQLALSFIFAFIGGFSESLVPNLLRRGEQSIGLSDKDPNSAGPIVKDMKP
jgi:hypothetical protein